MTKQQTEALTGVEKRKEHLRSEIDRCNAAIEGGDSDPWWREDLGRFKHELRCLEAPALATPSPAPSDTLEATARGDEPWAFNAEAGDVELRGCPVFKVYRADDFPCIEDDEREEADRDYLAHAQVAVMLLNMVATTDAPSVGEAYRALLAQATALNTGGSHD